MAKHPRPLTISRSESDIPITRATLPQYGQPISLKARLLAAAERGPFHASNKGTLRSPIDKCTRADMPIVQDAHLTSALDYLDLDLAGEWEEHPGGKLLAIPFDNEIHNREFRNSVCSRIFVAVAESLNPTALGSPPPNQARKPHGLGARLPLSLFTNL
jgi:hypothetical protein